MMTRFLWHGMDRNLRFFVALVLLVGIFSYVVVLGPIEPIPGPDPITALT